MSERDGAQPIPNILRSVSRALRCLPTRLSLCYEKGGLVNDVRNTISAVHVLGTNSVPLAVGRRVHSKLDIVKVGVGDKGRRSRLLKCRGGSDGRAGDRVPKSINPMF